MNNNQKEAVFGMTNAEFAERMNQTMHIDNHAQNYIMRALSSYIPVQVKRVSPMEIELHLGDDDFALIINVATTITASKVTREEGAWYKYERLEVSDPEQVLPWIDELGAIFDWVEQD